MWRPQRAIEGVSARSVVELKALLTEEVERAKRERAESGGGAPRRKRPRESAVADEHNRGVEQRAARDAREQGPQTDEERARTVEAALRAKAATYDAITRGALPLPACGDVCDRECMVEFALKQLEEQPQVQSGATEASIFAEPQLQRRDGGRPRARAVADVLEEAVGTTEHREAIEEVCEETRGARELAQVRLEARRKEHAERLALIRKKQKQQHRSQLDTK